MENKPPIVVYNQEGDPTHIIVYKDNFMRVFDTVPSKRESVEGLFNNKKGEEKV